jgi:hypothetical protein
MAKDNHDDIDRYLDEVETLVIPEEFITAACITDLNGDEYYVTYDEAAEIMSNGSLRRQGISQVRAIVDMEFVKETVVELSEQILNSISA